MFSVSGNNSPPVGDGGRSRRVGAGAADDGSGSDQGAAVSRGHRP